MSMRDAITDLLFDYAACIDAGEFEAWLDLFTEDASYRAVPRENFDRGLPVALIYCTNKNMLRDRIVSLREANEYNFHYDRHLITNVRVRALAEAEWQVDANYAVMQTDMEGNSRLFSVGRYQDRVRVEEERLLFCEKLVVIDNFSVPTLLATPL